MDGRPHPGPNAPHTWMGFSTGRYDGDMLIVETTHLKKGWVRRNGVPMSDQAKMTEYMVRNGEVMTHIVVLIDPVYLTEPLVKSQEFVRSTRELPAGTWLWVCDPVLEIATREEGEVPAYLPGEHPFKEEYARRHQIPLDRHLRWRRDDVSGVPGGAEESADSSAAAAAADRRARG